jgi:DNA-binding cell septation regulator SpoVG
MAKIEVKSVKKINKEGSPLKAFVSICINGVISINGCTLVSGEKGTFVGMPSKQGKDNRYYPEVVIHSDSLKEEILVAVSKAYDDKQEQL